MTRTQLTTGIAVTISLVIVGLVFLWNPFTGGMFNPQGGSANQAAQQPQGLVIQDESVGTGAVAMPGAVVQVHYTGKLQDGTVFDSSVGKSPLQFTLGDPRMIPGFSQGVSGMKVGGKRLLIIPPTLAYGAQQNGPIPPNSTLVFEVELVSVTQGTTTPAPAQ